MFIGRLVFTAGWPETPGAPAGRLKWPPASTLRTIGRAAGAEARSALTRAGSSGRPGLARSSCSRAANETGGGGGAVLATIARSANRAGGACTFAPAATPRLTRVGAIGGAAPITCAFTNCPRGTTTAAIPTGRAPTNASRGTTTIAPGTPWFTYRTFPAAMLLITVTLPT